MRTAWASTFCYEGPHQENDMRAEVTGTLELWVNDETRVAGHLRMETSGETNGRCTTHKTRANVEFDFQPGPVPERPPLPTQG